MPRGTHHDETGIVTTENGQLVLLRDDGGRWRLDAPLRAREYIGQRMRVKGTRSGFDLLDVISFEKSA